MSCERGARFSRFSSLFLETAQFRTMSLSCLAFHTPLLHGLLPHASFVQILPVLAVQLRCIKLSLVYPSSAILRRTVLLYLPEIRIDAYSLNRPHPARRISGMKRHIPRQSSQHLSPRSLFAAAQFSYANGAVRQMLASRPYCRRIDGGTSRPV